MMDTTKCVFRKIEPSVVDWGLIESAYDSTVFHSRKWNEYVLKMGYKPFVSEVLVGEKVVGHFVGGSKHLLIKIIMAPSMGTGTYSQGLCMQKTITKKERLDIYLQLVEWLFKSKQADYIQICDWNLRTECMEEMENWCDPDLDSKKIHYNLRTTYFLEIDKPLDELWSNLHYKSCKYSINKARKNGLTAKIVEREEDIESFVDQHYLHIQDMLKRKKSYGLPCQRRKNMSALCHALFPDRVVMLQVVGKNEAGEDISMASGIFANGRAGSTYYTGASYQQYMRYCPNELMVWEAICVLHERDAGSFIFGGVDPYKKKFGSSYAYIPVMIFSRFVFLQKVRRLLKRGYEKMGILLWHLKNRK